MHMSVSFACSCQVSVSVAVMAQAESDHSCTTLIHPVLHACACSAVASSFLSCTLMCLGARMLQPSFSRPVQCGPTYIYCASLPSMLAMHQAFCPSCGPRFACLHAQSPAWGVKPGGAPTLAQKASLPVHSPSHQRTVCECVHPARCHYVGRQ